MIVPITNCGYCLMSTLLRFWMNGTYLLAKQRLLHSLPVSSLLCLLLQIRFLIFPMLTLFPAISIWLVVCFTWPSQRDLTSLTMLCVWDNLMHLLPVLISWWPSMFSATWLVRSFWHFAWVPHLRGSPLLWVVIFRMLVVLMLIGLQILLIGKASPDIRFIFRVPSFPGLQLSRSQLHCRLQRLSNMQWHMRSRRLFGCALFSSSWNSRFHILSQYLVTIRPLALCWIPLRYLLILNILTFVITLFAITSLMVPFLLLGYPLLICLLIYLQNLFLFLPFLVIVMFWVFLFPLLYVNSCSFSFCFFFLCSDGGVLTYGHVLSERRSCDYTSTVLFHSIWQGAWCVTGLPKFYFQQPHKPAVTCGNFRQCSAAGDKKFLYQAHNHQMILAPGQNQHDVRDYSASGRGCVMRDCRIERNTTVLYSFCFITLIPQLSPFFLTLRMYVGHFFQSFTHVTNIPPSSPR